MKFTFYIAILTSLSLFTACSTKKNITQVQNENTSVTKADFGSEGVINIPDEWVLSSENKLTNQKFFRNKDSILLAITRNPMEKYSFHVVGMEDTIFTQAFYDWESKHYEKQGMEVKMLEKSFQKDYIIWTAKGKDNVNAVLLYGGKKEHGYAMTILDPRNLTLNQQKAFLIQVYRDN
jgi:hypothetical protein